MNDDTFLHFHQIKNLTFQIPTSNFIFHSNKQANSNFFLIFCVYRNWELTAPWTGAQVKVPVKFIIGELDLTYNAPGAKDYIHKGGFKKDVPLLQEVVVIEGAGHFIQEEKSDEINKHILDFIKQFSS